MRSILPFLVILAVPQIAHAQIAEPRGTVRVPGFVEVHAIPYDSFADRQVRSARDDIERRRESGELSKREARRLRREADRVEAMSYRYARDGLTETERRELQVRADSLAARANLPRMLQASARR